MSRRRRSALLAVVATTLAVTRVTILVAQDRPATLERPTLAEGQIDPRVSRVYIFVGKTGLGHEHGVEGKIQSGALALGATTNAGQIVFDTTTFQADTPAARQYVGLTGTTDADTERQVNANMLGPSVLDVKHYPTATFKVTSILPIPGAGTSTSPHYQLDGEFTLHGTTRKIKTTAEATTASGYVRLRGKFAILQSHYGITPYSKAFGAIGVADELTIFGDLWIAAAARGSK